MRSIFRNLRHILSRFRVSSALNIIGLSVAFTVFLIVIMQVRFQLDFDKYHSNEARIYRVDKENPTTRHILGLIQPRPLLETFFKSSPQIESGVVIMPYIGEQYFTVLDNQTDERRGYKENITVCSPTITHIFDFKMLEGSPDCLDDPQNILIPRSVAERLFLHNNALGSYIQLEKPIWMKDGFLNLKVGGVYEDLPENTQLKNCIYTSIGEDAQMKNWGVNNFIGYILLKNDADYQNVVENFNRNFDFKSVGLEDMRLILTPLTSIYFKNEVQDGLIVKSGNPNTPFILISIAILIVLLAAINYTNFNMALAPRRMRNINTRKVLGSGNASLRLHLIVEGVFISLISFILAIVFVYILYKWEILAFIKADLNLANHIPTVLLTTFLSIGIGVIASIRPAFYLTSQSPALALKGSFGLSPSGRKLRTLLVGFQFFISIVLIIVSTFIYIQNQYIQKQFLGFNTDNIASVELSQTMWEKDRNKLINTLKDNSDIADVAFAQQQFGASDEYRAESGEFGGQEFGFYYIPVSWNFIQTMDIKLIDGKYPHQNLQDDWTPYYGNQGALWSKYIKSNRYLLINKKLSETYGLKPGDYVMHNRSQEQIIGIVDNIKFTSLRKESGNLVFVINDPYALPAAYAYIRIKAGADMPNVISYINNTFSELDSAYPLKLQFYDQIYNNLYKQENEMEKTIGIFSLIAIIISVVGVFGLVMFECEYRQKEISLRKVLGSTTIEILKLFNKTYIRIFFICFLFSLPVAYYSVVSWLNNFAYKTPISWWVFIAAASFVLLIITSTVSLQSWRSANANPVDALKDQ